jgi:asparagine synthase (glutamine-hydrolysing)
LWHGWHEKKITVTLSGEGADEVFGGYSIYHEPASLRPLSWLPAPLLAVVGGASRLLPQFVPGKNYLRRAATPLEKRYVGNALIFSEEEKRFLLKKRNYPAATAVTGPLYERVKGWMMLPKCSILTCIPGWLATSWLRLIR